MTSRNIDIFDNPFRDPVYEEMGFMFDPERNQYYEIVQDPRLGEFRRYISPRDQSTPPELSDARTRSDMMDLLSQTANKNRVGALTDKEALALLEGRMGKTPTSKGLVKGSRFRFQSGGAVNDIDIFEETRRSIRDDQTPMMPTVTNEQPMFGMPSQDVRSSQNLGRGARESISVSGTPGIDQVFTQIMTSPDFRSIVRVEDVPPENLQQSKKIFEFLMKRDGIDQAVQYLVDTFGKATMFPIEKSLGPDPRTQRVSGMEESRMSSGIGSLMQ